MERMEQLTLPNGLQSLTYGGRISNWKLEINVQKVYACTYTCIYIYICICLYYDDITCMSTECVQIDVVDIEMKFMICD